MTWLRRSEIEMPTPRGRVFQITWILERDAVLGRRIKIGKERWKVVEVWARKEKKERTKETGDGK